MPQKKDDKPIIQMGAPEWVVTFGDMMTLLLCFFVLLFAMSEINAVKLRIITNSIRDMIGKEEASRPTFEPRNVPGAELENMRDTQRGEHMEGGLADQMTLKETKERVQNLREFPPVSITTGYKLRFGEDSLELTAESKVNLVKIVELLRGYPQQRIEIIGHSKPLKNIVSPRYTDLYELAYDRARKVHRLLTDPDSHNLDPKQFKITSVGQHYPPVSPNWTQVDMSDNDRVEIIVTKVPLPAVPAQETKYRYNIKGPNSKE